MKTNKFFIILLATCIFLPLTAKASPLHTQVERAVLQAVSNDENSPHYYIALVQLNEEETSPGADGPEAGIFWVEIGGESTADGYEPEFFYLISSEAEEDNYDGPSGPFYEEIVPAIFNEAYRRYAADPRCVKATVSQTRQLLTKYYRQVEAEKKAPKAQPAN